MNFKRTKSKRVIRCSYCTQHRFLGNSKLRHSHRDEKLKVKARYELQTEIQA